jgi:regulatory protein
LENRALKLLARREYSRLELKTKLARHAGDADSLEALLDSLEERGWLSQSRFVEAFIASRREKYGSYRIRRELHAKGIEDEVIAGALKEIERDELGRARQIWERKFGAQPRDLRERARQTRFLENRGFSRGTIARVLRQQDE